MGEERYVLNCPNCGRVEGIVPLGDEDDEGPPEAEMVIEQQVFRTAGGMCTRVRCPRCGKWTKADRARPA